PGARNAAAGGWSAPASPGGGCTSTGARVSSARKSFQAFWMGHAAYEDSNFRYRRVVRGRRFPSGGRSFARRRTSAQGPATSGCGIVLSGRPEGTRQHARRLPFESGAPTRTECGGVGGAARGLSLLGTGCGVLLCAIEGPEIRPRGGDRTLALRSLRLLVRV